MHGIKVGSNANKQSLTIGAFCVAELREQLSGNSKWFCLESIDYSIIFKDGNCFSFPGSIRF